MGVDNLKAFEAFYESLSYMAEHSDEFITECVKDVAAEFLSRLRLRSPVSENELIRYYGRGGQVLEYKVAGGTYRRGWTVDDPESDTRDITPEQYVETAEIKKTGSGQEMVIANNTEYAAPLEYGHRQNVGQFVPVLGSPDKNGVVTGATLKAPFVPGQYILTNVEAEMQQMVDARLAVLLDKYIQENFDW